MRKKEKGRGNEWQRERECRQRETRNLKGRTQKEGEKKRQKIKKKG